MTEMREQPMPQVIEKDELPHSETAHRFEGHLYGGADVSFFPTRHRREDQAFTPIRTRRSSSSRKASSPLP